MEIIWELLTLQPIPTTRRGPGILIYVIISREKPLPMGPFGYDTVALVIWLPTYSPNLCQLWRMRSIALLWAWNNSKGILLGSSPFRGRILSWSLFLSCSSGEHLCFHLNKYILQGEYLACNYYIFLYNCYYYRLSFSVFLYVIEETLLLRSSSFHIFQFPPFICVIY
jgi:hypothetical protein